MEDDWKKAENIYVFSVDDIDGQRVSLDKYRGHVCLIVNVASQCGKTDVNYKQLQELHTKYGQSADTAGSPSPTLKILAFPCNQFLSQEPGTNEEIKQFATGKYGVQFDMFSKINVNGDGAHPLWKYLKSQQSGFLINAIKWNFTKFLVNKDGIPIQRYSPRTEPMNIEKDIVEELKK